MNILKHIYKIYALNAIYLYTVTEYAVHRYTSELSEVRDKQYLLYPNHTEGLTGRRPPTYKILVGLW